MQKILISLSVILLLSFCDGNKKNSSFQLKGTLSDSKFHSMLAELESIPEKVKLVLEKNDLIEKIAEKPSNKGAIIYILNFMFSIINNE